MSCWGPTSLSRQKNTSNLGQALKEERSCSGPGLGLLGRTQVWAAKSNFKMAPCWVKSHWNVLGEHLKMAFSVFTFLCCAMLC